MNNEQLARLKAISGQDSYLYQLAQENSVDGLKTSENDIPDDYVDPETMQERADEFRKDDSEPEQEYWFDVTVDQSSVVASSLEEAERKIKEVIALGVDYEVYEISEVEL